MPLVFINEPRDEAYVDLLRFCQAQATHAAFILQSSSPPVLDRVRHVLEPLRPYLVSIDQVSSWPGHRLGEHSRVERYLYPAQEEVIDVLVTAASGLFDWMNPKLPDDLHFLDGDAVVLGQVAHEKLAWIGVARSKDENLPASLAANVEERPIDGLDALGA